VWRGWGRGLGFEVLGDGHGRVRAHWSSYETSRWHVVGVGQRASLHGKLAQRGQQWQLREELTVLEITTGNTSFAVCHAFTVRTKSDTRQRPSLLCASSETHGRNVAHDKYVLCRAPHRNAHSKAWAHGKECRLSCVLQIRTRQSCITQQCR